MFSTVLRDLPALDTQEVPEILSRRLTAGAIHLAQGDYTTAQKLFERIGSDAPHLVTPWVGQALAVISSAEHDTPSLAAALEESNQLMTEASILCNQKPLLQTVYQPIFDIILLGKLTGAIDMVSQQAVAERVAAAEAEQSAHVAGVLTGYTLLSGDKHESDVMKLARYGAVGAGMAATGHFSSIQKFALSAASSFETVTVYWTRIGIATAISVGKVFSLLPETLQGPAKVVIDAFAAKVAKVLGEAGTRIGIEAVQVGKAFCHWKTEKNAVKIPRPCREEFFSLCEILDMTTLNEHRRDLENADGELRTACSDGSMVAEVDQAVVISKLFLGIGWLALFYTPISCFNSIDERTNQGVSLSSILIPVCIGIAFLLAARFSASDTQRRIAQLYNQFAGRVARLSVTAEDISKKILSSYVSAD